MTGTKRNFLVDLISFMDLLLLAATGVILRWVLPPGSGGGHGHGFGGGRGAAETKTLLGLGRHDWGDVHSVLALVFLLLMLLHLYLHWTWIRTCGTSILFPARRVPRPPRNE